MKRIVILGPESTGKSTLALNLSNHYQAYYVNEYARDYLKFRNDYLEEDLLQIAIGQLQLEDEGEQECRKKDLPMIFYDTDLTVIKIWSEFKYGKCDPWILEQHKLRKYDLYLLAYPDLEWHPDPMRENPKDRDRMKIFELYQKDLKSRKVEFRIIKGIGEKRNKNAIEIVDRLLK